MSGENRYSDGNFRQVRGLGDFVALRRSHTILTTTRRATAASRKRPQSRKLRWIHSARGRSPTRTRRCSCCRACGARTRSPRSARRSPRERSGNLNHSFISMAFRRGHQHAIEPRAARQHAGPRRLRCRDAIDAPRIDYFSNRLLLPVHPFNERAVDVGPPLVQQLHRISDFVYPR